MHPADRSILPEIPAAIPSCLEKTPSCRKMIIYIHELGQDGPTHYLEKQETYDKNASKKIPGYILQIFSKHYFSI
jgi:hypothetical protein